MPSVDVIASGVIITSAPKPNHRYGRSMISPNVVRRLPSWSHQKKITK